MAKIDRKYMAHYLDASFKYAPDAEASTPVWYRLGSDLEEFNVELNPDVEIVQNFLGEDIVIHNKYDMEGEAEPFYAREGDALFKKLQRLINYRRRGSYCYTLALEVHLWNDYTYPDGYYAIMYPCYVVPVSYGGDTSGYQIPFTVHYLNSWREIGYFVPDGKNSGTFHAG